MSLNQLYSAIRTENGFEVFKIPPLQHTGITTEYHSDNKTFRYFKFDIDGKEVIIYLSELMYSEEDYTKIKEAWKKQNSNWS